MVKVGPISICKGTFHVHVESSSFKTNNQHPILRSLFADPSLEDRLRTIEDNLNHQVEEDRRRLGSMFSAVIDRGSQLDEVEEGVRTNARKVEKMQPVVTNNKNTIKYLGNRTSTLENTAKKLASNVSQAGKTLLRVQGGFRVAECFNNPALL